MQDHMISPGISLEGMILKLKLQYFGHLVQRVDSLDKALLLEGIGGRRRRGQQRMRWLDGITDSMDVSLSFAEGSGAGGVQTAKASRKQSSLSGKESAQGCLPKRLLGRPD